MKLLIVDREIAAARNLKNSVNWTQYGINAVFTAYSEEKARETFFAERPDVVLYSLQDGEDAEYSFPEELKQKAPETELIVTGGALSEQGVRKLLRLGVLDYLKTPYQKEALLETLERLGTKQALRRETEEKRRYGEYWKRNAVLIQEMFWKNLCLNRIAGGPEAIEEAAVQVNASLDKDSRYGLILITLHNQMEMQTTWGDDLCQFAVQNLARATMPRQESSRIIVIYTRVVIVLDEKDIGGAEDACRKLAEKCMNELGAKILCYVSEPVFCEQFAATYNTLLSYSKDDVLHQNLITRIGKRQPEVKEEIRIPKDWEELLYASKTQELVTEVRNFLTVLAKQGRLNEKRFRIFQQDMLQLFFTYMEKRELKAYEMYDNGEIYKLYKIAILSVEGMCRWIETCADYIARRTQNENDDVTERVVGKVKSYIAGNLKNEVTMEQIAKITHLNADYTTRIFKRKTGLTVKEYLIKKRMEYAKRMLSTTDASVSEIALEAGYDNFSYFIRQFKKTFGVTPKQFQKNLNHQT